jgi:hypothetical protein
VLVDGLIRASHLHSLRVRLNPRGLGDGRHEIRVLATARDGQQVLSQATVLEVDGNAPQVTIDQLRGRRIRVSVDDPASGANPQRTVIEFGDHSHRARNQLSAVHRYRARGLYLITVRCADFTGNAAAHHIWVEIR